MMSATTKVAEDVMLGGKHSAKLEYIGEGARGRATWALAKRSKEQKVRILFQLSKPEMDFFSLQD